MTLGKRTAISFDYSKGQYAAGDAGSIPDGYARDLLNYLPRPNRLAARPPFTYDGLLEVNGLANWDDLDNEALRLIALDSTAALHIKDAGSETWGTSVAGTDGGDIVGYVNYRGIVYALTFGTGAPYRSFSYDGATLNETPFADTSTENIISARTISVFRERLYLGSPRFTYINYIGKNGSVANTYDFTSTYWTKSNCSAVNITSGSATTCRIIPTTTNSAFVRFHGTGVPTNETAYTIAARATPMPVVVRFDLRGVDAVVDVPVTAELLLTMGWQATHAYVVGDYVVDGAGFKYVCSVAGTSGGAAPAWSTATNTVTNDNTVRWTSQGSDVLNATTDVVPNLTKSDDWLTVFVAGAIPPATNTLTATVRLKLYTSTASMASAAPIDVSYQDGLTDGDPRKANHGPQLTSGPIYFDFFNQDGVGNWQVTQDVDGLFWTRIGQPTSLQANQVQKLPEAAGYLTAVAVTQNRRIDFKRRAFWVFLATSDPYVPIRMESINTALGCLAPTAVDVMNDDVYFIAENGVYRYAVGDTPQELCGDAMREAIMARGADWVESQANYNRPLLVIDPDKLLLYVYTQKAKLFVYDIQRKAWTTFSVGSGVQVQAMLFNATTRKMYVSFEGAHGIARLDYSATPTEDTIDNTGTTYPGHVRIVFRPIEVYQPPRYDATLEELRTFHAVTVSRSGQTLTASFSFDQGTSYPRSIPFSDLPLSSGGEMVPLVIPVFQTAPSITTKLEHVGKLGEAAWSLSPRFSAKINVRRGEYPQAIPTPGSGNL